MIHLKQAVIVEGKYDKIKLSSVIDGLIITTDGFGIFKDREKIELLKTLAETNGIIILTDSDSAGFKIRNHIKSCVRKGEIHNIFIPDIFGKEKRKQQPSKEGKLGVEGVPVDVLLNAFARAGITSEKTERSIFITKSTLMNDGFIGMENSETKRKQLQHLLGLPERMSANVLLEVLNGIFTFEDYSEAVNKIKDSAK